MEVEDFVNIGWGAGVHQFCKLGRHCMVSACSKLVQDVAPFMLADGSPAETRSINKVGLERADFSADEIEIARAVFKKIYRSDLNRGQAIDFIEKESPLRDHPVTQEIIAFAKKSERGLA